MSPHRSDGQPGSLRLRDPRGYILPADQPDFLTATKFVNALLRTGVTVFRAAADFKVGTREYPAGSYVIKTAQAFRPHVLDMFEPQDHPDDVLDEGGMARLPYDSAGWTLAFQMGVKFDRVLDAFDGPLEKVVGVAEPPPGSVVHAQGAAGYLVSHRQNDAIVAVNRLVQTGEKVLWLGDGTIYVAAGPRALPLIERTAKESGLRFTGVTSAPAGAALQLNRVRVALVDRYGGWTTGGWIRWLLERYEFPFEVVYPPSLDAGNLASRYDVIILPSEAVRLRSITRCRSDTGSTRKSTSISTTAPCSRSEAASFQTQCGLWHGSPARRRSEAGGPSARRIFKGWLRLST